MDATEPATWFAGDLADPWALAIAEAMPRSATRFGEGWPESWPGSGVVVLHTSRLSNDRIEALKLARSAGGAATRIILCLGPHVRAWEAERCSALADVTLAEATAPDVIARYLDDRPRTPPSGRGRKVSVVVHGFEARRVLVEACEGAGFEVRGSRDWDDARADSVALWDVPLLEPGWEATLRRETVRQPVVVLLGFADRQSVASARAAGASACLDSPCDLADLLFVLDRVATRPAIDHGHAVPPPPMGLRDRRSVGRPAPLGLE